MKKCTKIQFSTELERGLCKHRFNEHFERTKRRKDKHNGLNVGKQEDDRTTLELLWEDEAHRYPYNPFLKELNFCWRRPTDYKLNTRITLPKPLSNDQEFGCELKKRAYFDAYDEYHKNSRDNKNDNKENNSNDGNISSTTREGGQTNKKIHNGMTSNKGKKKKGDDLLNLTEAERRGFNILNKRIENEEVVVTPTDKSSRFAILTHDQYLQAGDVHTRKDTPISWEEVRYIKNQVNSHMWWYCKMWSYCKNTDPERMLNNVTVSGIDLPEMSLLVKDHKSWSVDSGEPVPTRPVMSGNCTVNTHLSELISELIEPVVLEYEGAEVQSSEEVLALIDDLNEKISVNNGPPSNNVLKKFSFLEYQNKRSDPRIERGISQELAARDNIEEITQTPIFNEISNITGLKDERLMAAAQTPSQDLLDIADNSDSRTITSLPYDSYKLPELDTEDFQTVDLLCELGMEALKQGNRGDDMDQDLGLVWLFDSNEPKEAPLKRKITDFFKTTFQHEEEKDNMKKWRSIVSEGLKKDFNSDKGTLNERLVQGVKAGQYWNDSNKRDLENTLEHSVTVAQDTQADPILFGCDVVGLYPNLEPISVAHVTAQAVEKTNVKFKGVNFYFMIVYLTLILGQSQMDKMGLGGCVARKKKVDKVHSLSALSNRNMDAWEFSRIKLTDTLKRKLISVTIQLMVLLMTSSTCYKFGGKIYKQKSGLGIGLRGSAALARLLMCTWDSLWGSMQYRMGLIINLFCRYVDDIRLYLRPILPGYRWTDNGWTYSNEPDMRSPRDRTIEELNKSLNGVWNFLDFTTEWQEQFVDGFLPTLDFATKVVDKGYVSYKFYSKPMSRNTVLQRGTALSDGCVFSSLRQDLVRRLLNTDASMGSKYRVSLVKEYIQLLVNSDHKFSYIKSIILQALTKYTFMVSRSLLGKNNKMYLPIHRLRNFMAKERKLIKYTNRAVWYTGTDVKDKYRNFWKRWIKRKGDFNKSRKGVRKSNINPQQGSDILEHRLVEQVPVVNIPDKPVTRGDLKKPKITTALFIPKTPGAVLAKMIEQGESEIAHKVGWKAKILEKPGTPLSNFFVKKFKMKNGCYRGKECICKGNGSSCTVKGVVYRAICSTCSQKKNSTDQQAVYVGETARQIGARAAEHITNARLFKPQSFIIDHWMLEHPTDTAPPVFEFKVVSKFKDPLSRQVREALTIKEEGNLNKRNEYSLNEIIRMESSRYVWQEMEDNRRQAKEEKLIEQCKRDFINVMYKVSQLESNTCDQVILAPNGNNFYRLKFTKRKSDRCTGAGNKRIKCGMDSSTPLQYRNSAPVLPESPTSSPILQPLVTDLTPTDSVEQGDPTQGRTNLSNGTAALVVTTDPDPEPLVGTLARNAIAIRDHTEGERSYLKRKLLGENTQELLPAQDWQEEIRFKGNASDSRSFNISDLLRDQDNLHLDWLFDLPGEVTNIDLDTDHDPDLGLNWLFDSIEDHFGEEDVNEGELQKLIESKTKNSLYDLFLKNNNYSTGTPKRKHSPEEETSIKLRRLTISDSSPSLRSPALRVARQRTFSSGSRALTKGRKKIQPAKDSNQKLITELFPGIKKN